MKVWAAAELHERDAELKAVDSAIYAARAGHGCMLAIEGPPGIGKTSLVGIARDRARAAGMRVLAARGSELERDFAFGVVRQLLEPLVFAAEAAERERWFAGAAGQAAPLFKPAASVERSREEEEEVRFRRRHGLYWLVANLARDAPLLLAVDDAQWADEPSLGVLRHLATRLEPLSVLALIACRSHADSVSGLLVDPATHVVRPSPLSHDAVALLVHEDLGRPPDDAFASACHEATAGNPFLVRELLREVEAEGVEPTAAAVERLRRISPRGVATSVLLRVAALPPAAGALARAAAVLGEAELSAVAALAGVEHRVAVEAAATLARAGLLELSEPLRFVHPLVRAALYEDVAPAERRLAHVRAARQLHGAGAAPDRVAAQLVLGAPTGEAWAFESLKAAGRQARLRGAPEVAARFLQRALEESRHDGDRVELLLALGRAEVLAGTPNAIDHLRAAVELAATPEQYARAAVKLGRVLRFSGAGGEAVELLERAEERLGGTDHDLANLIEHELLATSTVSYEARRRLTVRAERWAARADRPPRTFFDRFVVAAEAVEMASRGRRVAQVLELAESALAEGVGVDHLGRHVRMLATYAFLLADRFDRADAQLRVLADAASQRGGAQLLAIVAAQRALVASRRGDVAAAEAEAADALRLAADLDAPPAYLFTAVAALLWAAAERGEPPHRLAADVRDDGDSLFGRHLNYARATLAIAEGRLEQGVSGLLAVGEREQRIGWTGPAQFAWRSDAALALAAMGDHQRARRLADEELELARAFGGLRAFGIALRARALLDDGARRLSRLQEAVATLEGSGATLEHARALADLGETLRRARQPAEARQPLRRAHELATRCGATRLAKRTRDELLASGSRPRRAALTGRDALTPSERRVVELAAQERTNRDIAQTLFITEKTVETHLRHSYAKLGLKSRRELAGALARTAG